MRCRGGLSNYCWQLLPLLLSCANHAVFARSRVSRHFQNFITRPDIDAPVWELQVTKANTSTVADGYWFVAFYDDLGQTRPGDRWIGPHIYDSKGGLIWSGGNAFKHWATFDFDFAGYGENVELLTLLSYHEGMGYILDSNYQVQREIPLVEEQKLRPNMHEFRVIRNATRALVFTEHYTLLDEETTKGLTGVVGRCRIRFGGFQELDLESPDSPPLFEWSATNHIEYDESNFKGFYPLLSTGCALEGLDMLHLNSIEKFLDGDYLLSARHTDTLYKISHVDGSIIWRLGGNKSNFKFLGDAAFSRQHHARVRSQNETHTIITLIDNAIGYGFQEVATHNYSRGLVLSLDHQRMTAAMLLEYIHPDKDLVELRGSFQTLSNGNVFLCWSTHSLISEYASDGALLMQARLPMEVHTYRAYKYPWIGRPVHPPDAVSQAFYHHGIVITMVYISWNGATDVKFWRVMEVDEHGNSHLLTTVPRTGFETALTYMAFIERVVVEAANSNSEVLGKSKVTYTIPPSALGIESESAVGEGEHFEPVYSSPPAFDKSKPKDSDSKPFLPESANKTWPKVTLETLMSSQNFSIALFFVGIGVGLGLVIAFLIKYLSKCTYGQHTMLSWRLNETRYDQLSTEEELEEMHDLDKG